MNTNSEYAYPGTQLKLAIKFESHENWVIGALDYTVEAFTSASSRIVFEKSDTIELDYDTFMVIVDTAKLSSGRLKLKVTFLIPDGDILPSQKRREVEIIDTNIIIPPKI